MADEKSVPQEGDKCPTCGATLMLDRLRGVALLVFHKNGCADARRWPETVTTYGAYEEPF